MSATAPKLVPGARYGRLVAIRYLKDEKRWLFVCDCGQSALISSSNIVRTSTCGCLKKEPSSKIKDITGKKFGRLTAILRTQSASSAAGNTRSNWLCRCECGKEVTVALGNLQQGISKSCGCLRKDVLKKIKTKSVEHVILQMMWHYYQKNAKDRDLCWELTRQHFNSLVMAACHYCGRTGVNAVTTAQGRLHAQDNRTLHTNGIDRRVNEVCYTVDNAVTCCKDCNMAKGTRSEVEFIAWIKLANDWNHR